MDLIRDIETAADRYKAAEESLRQAVVNAAEGEESIAAISRAAGVTRQTVYRWIANRAEGGAMVDVRESLDDALMLMSGLIGPGTSQNLASRVGMDDIAVKTLGIQMGAAALKARGSVLRNLSEEDLARITLGQQVAALADKYRAINGKFPKQVTIKY